jgi:hypothetical protein
MFCFVALSQTHEDLLKFRRWRFLDAAFSQKDAQIALRRRISAMKILGCELQHGLIILGILRCRKLSHRLTRLRSAVGERGKWSGERRAAFSESQPERNAAAEPQTEARRCCGQSCRL